LSPDGATIAVATDGGIDVLDRPNGGSVRKLKVPTRTTTLAFTRDADVLAAKGIDSVVRLFDYKSGKVLHTMGEPKPAAPPLSSILRYYPFVADDLAVTPDGKSLAVGGGAALRRYSIATGKEVSHAQAHHDAVTAFAIAPDGKHLFSRGNDALIRRWNLARGAEITRFAEPRDTTAMAFAPDGTRMAVGSADGTIRIFSTADAKELHQLNAHSAVPVRLAFSPDGKRLASRSAVDPWLRVFDVDKGIELRKFEWKKIESANTKKIRYVDAAGFGLAFAPDGLRIATFVQLEPQMMRKAPVAADSAPAIRIWDIATGIEMRRLVPSNDRIVDHLAFSPDGRLLTADNSDRTVGLWEVGSGQERLLLGTPARVDPSRSPLLGVGLDNRITEGAVRFYGDALGFSPNGKLLASAGVDHSVRVWDISKGTEITKYTGHRSHPTALRFNTDGKSLVSSSADSTLLVWHLADVKPAARQNLDLNAADLARRWKDLRDESAPKAWTAAMDLIGAPKATVAFLQRELTPAPAVDMKKLQQWVADLDSDVFAKRSVALVELANAGDVAAPALRKLLASEPSVETRRRVEPLLERILVGTYDKDQLRVVRAIEVLERIDSAEANAVLERLAKGAPSAVMTRQAQGALARKNVGRQP
jgi:WD40 repeat protein